MANMVDTHAHILWGIDDGPRTLDASIEMLQMAQQSGTTAIVATPHFNDRFEHNSALIDSRIRELIEAHTPAIPIYRGCEFHFTVSNLDTVFETPSTYTLNGGSCLLLEFADFSIPPLFDTALRRFLTAGIRPVIAHPERNLLLQNAIPRLQDWVQMGCGLQITAQSLTGRFGKAARQSAWTLLQSNLVHVIASDAHDTQHRSPRLDEAHQTITRELGAETASLLLHTNPTAMLHNGKLTATEVAPRKKWFTPWQ